MLTVFIELITKDFYAHSFSLTHFLYLFFFIFCLIFPFIAAFASERFWIREEFEYETPYFNYNNELELFVLKNNKTFFYSTIEDLNDLFPRKLTTPSITYSTEDKNLDGLVEKINVKIVIPNTLNSDNVQDIIQGFKLGLFFDYGFNAKVKFLSKSMIFIDNISNTNLKYTKIIGDLEFKQKSKIFQGSISKNLYDSDLLNSTSTSPYDLNTIYYNYRNQNITTHFDYELFDKFLIPDEEETTIEVEINIPYLEKILITPTYLTTLKNAWIQYISIFIPVYIAVRLVFYFLINFGVFQVHAFGFNQTYDQANIKHKLE